MRAANFLKASAAILLLSTSVQAGEYKLCYAAVSNSFRYPALADGLRCEAGSSDRMEMPSFKSMMDKGWKIMNMAAYGSQDKQAVVFLMYRAQDPVVSK